MKKIFSVVLALLNITCIISQTEFDAMKMIQPDITGTARYMGMAGAFGALGGDASAIKDNPAGLGIYRSSEMTCTLNYLNQNSSSSWNDTKGSDVYNGLGFNNLAYIYAKPTHRYETENTGFLSSNWSFSFNRLKNFDRNSNINGAKQASSITDYMGYFTGKITSADMSFTDPVYDPYQNVDIPWISIIGSDGHLINETVTSGISSWNSVLNTGENVIPSFNIQERGSIDEYSIGWAGNFSNNLYFGTNMNMQGINYSKISQYKESFENGGGMTLSNTLTTMGLGINLNAGIIYQPMDAFRMGFSVHTPSVYYMTDVNYANLDYYLTPTSNGNFDSPSATNVYLLSSPWKFNASAAIILGQKGLISGEYAISYNTGAYFLDKNNSTQNYTDENNGIPTMLKDVKTLKIGAEYKYSKNLAFRIGYANMSAGTNPLADKLLRPNTTRTDLEYLINNSTNFITAGIGYRKSGWFIDAAFVYKIENETFYSYNSFAKDLLTNMQKRFPTETDLTKLMVNPANVNTISNNIVITAGFKF